ncbi:MAG: DUF4382 domain-containing protein [Bacteroidia bacterium]
MKTKMLLAAMVGGILLFSACEKEPVMNDQEPKKGSMDIKMTDAPANYDVLLLAVSKAEVYHEGNGWVELAANGEAFNVLELNNGQNKKIAQSTTLDAGVYTKVRLQFKNEVYLSTMASVGMFGTQSAGTFVLAWQGSNTVEIEIDEQLTAGGHAEVMLDFDAAKSVLEDAGNYYIRPVIRYVKNYDTGIDGQLEGSAQGMVIVNNGEMEASVTFSSNGAFKLSGLNTGAYQVRIDYLAQVNGDLEYRQKTINGVIVSDGQITHMGMISLE